MTDTVRRRNTTQLELSWTGTVQDFKSGVTEYIDAEALIDSEFMLDEAYMNAVDLSKTQVHKITSANLTSQSQTDPMVVTVVPARGSSATNAHLNKLRMGSRGNNTMVLMSTRGSTVTADEVVYDQNQHTSSSEIKIYPIEKLASSAHTSIIPEQDGSRTVLIMSDEAVDLLERGMEAIYVADHGTEAKMNLWEMKKRFDRPEIPQSAYDSVISRLRSMNEKAEKAVSDLSNGMGLCLRFNTITPRGFSGAQTFTLRLKIEHTPSMK